MVEPIVFMLTMDWQLILVYITVAIVLFVIVRWLVGIFRKTHSGGNSCVGCDSCSSSVDQKKLSKTVRDAMRRNRKKRLD